MLSRALSLLLVPLLAWLPAEGFLARAHDSGSLVRAAAESLPLHPSARLGDAEQLARLFKPGPQTPQRHIPVDGPALALPEAPHLVLLPAAAAAPVDRTPLFPHAWALARANLARPPPGAIA